MHSFKSSCRTSVLKKKLVFTVIFLKIIIFFSQWEAEKSAGFLTFSVGRPHIGHLRSNSAPCSF